MNGVGQGYFYTDPNDPNAQQKAKLAAALQNRIYNPQQAYSGIADAGSSIANAAAYQNIQNQNDPAVTSLAQRMGISPSDAASLLKPSAMSKAGNWLGSLFGMGGGS